MRKLKFLGVLVSMTVLMAVVFVPTAHAAGTADSTLAFSGTAHLPDFPCTGAVPCNGTFTGKINGAFKGKNSDGNKWQLVFKKATMTSAYTYQEPQISCPETGTASGTINVTGGVIVNSKYGTGTISSAHSTASFNWTRTGNIAIVNTTFSLTVHVGTRDKLVLSNAPITTIAAFATNTLPDCANGGPIDATVVGVGVGV